MPNKSLKMCNICGGIGKVLNDGVWVDCVEENCDEGFVDINKILLKPDIPKSTKIENERNYLNDIELFDSDLKEIN